MGNTPKACLIYIDTLHMSKFRIRQLVKQPLNQAFSYFSIKPTRSTNTQRFRKLNLAPHRRDVYKIFHKFNILC